ncbi:MAG: hypothetical protein SNJ64_03480, partial [Endomicrobiia bacterium]
LKFYIELGIFRKVEGRYQVIRGWEEDTNFISNPNLDKNNFTDYGKDIVAAVNAARNEFFQHRVKIETVKLARRNLPKSFYIVRSSIMTTRFYLEVERVYEAAKKASMKSGETIQRNIDKFSPVELINALRRVPVAELYADIGSPSKIRGFVDKNGNIIILGNILEKSDAIEEMKKDGKSGVEAGDIYEFTLVINNEAVELNNEKLSIIPKSFQENMPEEAKKVLKKTFQLLGQDQRGLQEKERTIPPSTVVNQDQSRPVEPVVEPKPVEQTKSQQKVEEKPTKKIEVQKREEKREQPVVRKTIIKKFSRRELARIEKVAKQILGLFLGKPRIGLLMPYFLTSILERFGKANKRFRYATPGQHYSVFPSYILKFALKRLIRSRVLKDKEVIEWRKELRKKEKELRKLNSNISRSVKRGRPNISELIDRKNTLENEIEMLKIKILERELDIQSNFYDKFKEIMATKVEEKLGIDRNPQQRRDFEELYKLCIDLSSVLRNRDPEKAEETIKKAEEIIKEIAKLLNLDYKTIRDAILDKELRKIIKTVKDGKETETEIVINNRIGFAPQYIVSRIMSTLEKDGDKNTGKIDFLNKFLLYTRHKNFESHIEMTKNKLISEAFRRQRASILYELLTKFLQTLFASTLTFLPILFIFGFGGIPFLPPATLVWVVITFFVGYYTTWPPSHKLALFLVGNIVKVPGQERIRDLKGYVEQNYTEENPLRLNYVVSKFSDNNQDADTAIFYIKQSLEAMKPTLEMLGNRIEINIIFRSDTGNKDVINYEVECLKKVFENYKESMPQVHYLYVNRAGKKWYDNDKSQSKKGGFGKKAGGIENLMHFLATGETKPATHIDASYEHSQDPDEAMFGTVWSDDLRRVLGVSDSDKRNNEELRQSILEGRNILLDENKIPEFTLLMDDKNELYESTLVTYLSVMLHPKNRHIVMGQPNISITAPFHEGRYKKSIWWDIMRVARDIHNESNAKVMAGIYGNQMAFFGKGIVRTKEYYYTVFEREALNHARDLSHDWNEAIYTENSEGLYGSTNFRVERLSVSKDKSQATIKVTLNDNQTSFLKILKTKDKILVYDLSRGEKEPVLTLNVKEEKENIDSAISRVVKFYNNAVDVGERDQLNFVTYLMRDTRWLIGDFQMYRTFLPYGKFLSPYHRLHLGGIARRFFGDPTFLSFIILMNLLWIFPTVFMVPTIPTLAIVTTIITLFGIIGLDRFVDPIRYSLYKIRLEGKYFQFFKNSIYKLT